MNTYKELESLGFFEWLSEEHNLKDTDMTPEYLGKLPLNAIYRTIINAMIFRWFSEKHKLRGLIEIGAHDYSFMIWDEEKDQRKMSSDMNAVYEEAEYECIKRLIELVKLPK